MDWISGKKTYLVAIAIGIVAGLQAAGILDDAAVEKAYGLLGALGLVTLRAGVAKAAPIVLAVLGLGLATAPANAQVAPDAPPAISCGGGACNFYLVSGGWSPHSKRIYVGGNAVDFVSGRFGVGLFGLAADGDVNFIGGVCAIPKVGIGGPLGFLCPPQPAE